MKNGSAAGQVAAPLLVAEKLSCVVGGRALFRDLSIILRPGDLVEVRGRNGGGKSTLLRCLAGLLPASAGQVRRRCGIDYVGHKPGLCGRLTAAENLHWLAALRGRRADGREIANVMGQVGLDGAGQQPCGALSAGQLQRAALARLSFGGARAWLLDEPLAALDDDGAVMFQDALAAHRARGGAAVCATHRPLTAPPDATRVLWLAP